MTGATGARRRMGVVGASLLIFTAGPAAMFAVPWLQRAHLIADTPIWLLVALLVACSAANALVQSFEARMSPTLGFATARGHRRREPSWVVYATGWGSILVIGFGVGIADALRAHGSRAWKPCLCWSGVAILGGEVTVALGWAPTILSPAVAHCAVAGTTVPLSGSHRARLGSRRPRPRKPPRRSRATARTSGISCSTRPT